MESFQTRLSGRISLIAFTGLVLLLAGCSGSSGGGSDPLPDPAPDTTPDSFSFAEQSGVALDSPIESEAVTISGIDEAVEISIEGGQYAIDGGDFTEADDEISDGQQVVVQVQSATTPGALTEATLTVGGVEATFRVTTQNDPTGYYTGSAAVKKEDNTDELMLDDVHGLITEDRFLMFSTFEAPGGADRSLTYEASNIEINGTDYTADLTIYDNGEILRELSVEGTVTEGSGLTMTMDGEGAGNGTIDLTYGQSNSQAAELSRIANDSENSEWGGDLNELSNGHGFIVDPDDGVISNFVAPLGTVFDLCTISGNVEPIEATALYSASITFTNCTDNDSDGEYTGLITMLSQSTEDDTLVLVFSDGTLAGAGVYD
jgi:hypothetical protein